MGPQDRWQGLASEDFVDSDANFEPTMKSDPWDVGNHSARIAKDAIQLGQDPYARASNADKVSVSEQWDLFNDFGAQDTLEETEWPDSEDSSQMDWDEPEPIVDADSSLSESLYPPDESITDISLELKIGEVFMQVAPISESQYARSLKLLKACGVARLRRILPWPRVQIWNGTELCLFIKFHRYWGLPRTSHDGLIAELTASEHERSLPNASSRKAGPCTNESMSVQADPGGVDGVRSTTGRSALHLDDWGRPDPVADCEGRLGAFRVFVLRSVVWSCRPSLG